MNSNRLDNTLNAILIVVGLSAMVTLSLDHVATDTAAMQATAPVQAVVKVASQAAEPVAKVVASADAADPR